MYYHQYIAYINRYISVITNVSKCFAKKVVTY